MGKYVDGYVLVIPEGKTEEYKKMAEMGRDAWMKNGALEYYECRGDDLAVKDSGMGEQGRSFMDMAGAKAGDTVWFSFVVFESKEHRDKVNAAVMAAMKEQYGESEEMAMPFDVKQMAYGGFVVEVQG